MKKEVLESLNRLYKLAESQAIKVDTANGGHCLEEQLDDDYCTISEALKKKSNLENLNITPLDIIAEVFRDGCWVRRNEIEEPYFDDRKAIGFDKQMIIGEDDKGIYFYANGPVRCYLNQCGKTWAFTREDLN